MTPNPCAALASLAQVLLAVVASCAPGQVRADDAGSTRWEYKLVAVSELVGDAAVNVEDFFANQEQEPPQTLEAMQDQAAQAMQEMAEKMQALGERMKQADTAFLRGLNDLGADGWEVVWMEKGKVVLLKRRVE